MSLAYYIVLNPEIVGFDAYAVAFGDRLLISAANSRGDEVMIGANRRIVKSNERYSDNFASTGK